MCFNENTFASASHFVTAIAVASVESAGADFVEFAELLRN